MFVATTTISETRNAPQRAQNIMISLPIKVEGVKSPYPTVVIVMTIKYI